MTSACMGIVAKSMFPIKIIGIDQPPVVFRAVWARWARTYTAT